MKDTNEAKKTAAVRASAKQAVEAAPMKRRRRKLWCGRNAWWRRWITASKEASGSD